MFKIKAVQKGKVLIGCKVNYTVQLRTIAVNCNIKCNSWEVKLGLKEVIHVIFLLSYGYGSLLSIGSIFVCFPKVCFSHGHRRRRAVSFRLRLTEEEQGILRRSTPGKWLKNNLS